ncbi:MAG: hypothetical protein AB8B51_21460 [Sedimentitalea sp.]
MPETSSDASDFDDLGPSKIIFGSRPALPNAPTAQITSALVSEIERGARFCAQLPRVEYSLDCLSDRMAFTARLVPRIKGYRALKSALNDAARETRALARQNRSANLPTGSAKLASGRTRPLVPFDAAKRDFIEIRVDDIISAARSRMWQVAANVRETRDHYEAFAGAMSAYSILAPRQS